MCRTGALLVVSALLVTAEVHRHPKGEVIPHEKYIGVVSETDSPVQKHYIASKDGLYIAAAIRKPKGLGPFPALIYFHGAPGGRGMEKLVTWSLGATGGPLWERLLQEGYAVIVADYRRIPGQYILSPVESAGPTTYVEDGEAVLDFVRSLPYVGKNRIAVYGVSLGGNLAAYLVSRQKVAAAVFGAGAVNGFLHASRPPAGATPGTFKVQFDEAAALKNIAGITCPVLALVGTEDPFMGINEVFHDLLIKSGKAAHLHIYEGGYHDFVAGPQGHQGRSEPLLTSTLDALEVTLAFLKKRM
ncbi:MAG TPA: dienelactone hydrolase family protein [Bryobacteraceae bacterium]|nr:dienelactone hydrolase family protein [Bryobacteraceae bacterium]